MAKRKALCCGEFSAFPICWRAKLFGYMKAFWASKIGGFFHEANGNFILG
jgi:hypothetical protein